jgi:hypothetical protein
MMNVFYRSRRSISLFLLVVFSAQLVPTTVALALTSGPSQPEVQSFQPAGTSDMVDLFSGDFSYNIPLFELPGPNGGYPFNLSYQSGISMDQEASWVGLGWNLQPGAITRQMRGLPDEFKGDQVYTKMSLDPSVTVGMSAGIGTEIFGAIGMGASFGVMLNSYKGFSYSLGSSVSLGKTFSSGVTAGIGLNVSLNSTEGVSLDPTFSLGAKNVNFGLGLGYNSKSGLNSISFEATVHTQKDYSTTNKEGKKKHHEGKSQMSGSASLSLAHPGYTPQITMPMRNVNIAARLSGGGSLWGIYLNGYVTGTYNEQWLADDKKRVPASAFGYLNYQNATNPKSLIDLNREKDGMVTKEGPNLAIPSLAYDIYSVNGQGISGMYRPMRNDYGILKDQETSSESTGGSIGVDIGPALSHVGISLSVNHSKSTTGGWTGNNNMAGTATFLESKLDNKYEPWYFKVHGEPTAEPVQTIENVGGEKAVRVKLTGGGINVVASNQLEHKTWSQAAPSSSSVNQERKVRNQVIQPYTNEQILNAGQEMLPHFKVKYMDASNTEQTFDRSSLPKHHIAGFTALTPEGLRYNYGIPAYNLYQEEVSYTARKQPGQVDRVSVSNNGQGDPHYGWNNTEKYLRRVEMPKYAHSHLLTSILGPDYVDVTGNGVTEDDLGYWVKFTYKKTTTDTDRFKWRDPFSKAHLQEGWKTDPRDDKGSFVYGEKEMWYMARAETKSHIATFALKEREDGKGVAAKLQDSDDWGKSVYSLEEIKLYTRFGGSAVPIKVVRFKYDYSLCKGAVNSAVGKGKLTLKELWFEYGSSQRGRLNPYLFSYHSTEANYDVLAYDRWGNYKPYPGGEYSTNRDFPYVNQDPSQKELLDNNAAVWSLTEIQLPSGGKVKVDYESDDYAYVQHKPAMQMTEIVGPQPAAPGSKLNLTDSDLKVRFKLEKPIDVSPSVNQKAEALKYLDESRGQLYFKLLLNIRSPAENFEEFIMGYADIDFARAPGLETDNSGEEYVYGYFFVKPDKGYHPFSMRAWQHLRTNQPELANSGAELKRTDNTDERVDQIRSLGSVIDQVRQMFEGFYSYCRSKNWGRQLTLGKSWVRLKSPDKIKFGGGLRVKQITMSDQWEQDKEGLYGQVYEYTTEEGTTNPVTVSSGVAAYEPIVGGDENPLRYAKKWTQTALLRSDNNLFFEYPINESYYPGPQVGYSKVTVMSLASASLAGKDVKNITFADGKKLFPTGSNVSYGTSGKTVHEFYTAKDFPVITDETEKDNKPFNLTIAIPFIGSVSVSKLTASQGYSIVTNDMHGKQKKVSNYRQDRAGKLEPEPISWVKYNYASVPRQHEKENVFLLRNRFKDNGDGTLSLATASDLANPAIHKVALGQETEFFMDMRQFKDDAWTGGVHVNLDVLYFLFFVLPAFVPWPSVSKSETQLRTAVTNKIIFKTGILESVEAFDGGSLVKTNNVKWDKQTGATVLTTVNNNFEAPIYSYTIPAYTKYQGMGAAYQNSGLAFSATGVQPVPNQANQYRFSVALAQGSLYPGDEILLYGGSRLAGPVARAVYTGEEDGTKRLHSEQTLTASQYKALIVRSGYRNQLTVSAGSITALEDPSKSGAVKKFTARVQVPVIE